MNSYLKVAYKDGKHVLNINADSFLDFKRQIQKTFEKNIMDKFGLFIIDNNHKSMVQITQKNYQKLKSQIAQDAAKQSLGEVFVVKLIDEEEPRGIKECSSDNSMSKENIFESVSGSSTECSFQHEGGDTKINSKRLAGDIPCLKCFGEKKLNELTCPKCKGTGLISNVKKNKFLQDFMTKRFDEFKREAETMEKSISFTTFQNLNDSLANSNILPNILSQKFDSNSCFLNKLPNRPSLEETTEASEVRSVRNSLKARINKLNEDIITHPPKEEFSINFEIINNGQDKWPEGIELYCVEGYFETEKVIVEALNPGEATQVLLKLRMPSKQKIFNSSWRLRHNGLDELRYFGPRFTYKFKSE